MDNEIVYLNFYRCDRCGEEWEDAWDSEVDDDCPSCGKRHMTSYKSEPMYDKDLELSRYPNDILMGGGHRTCHKCGKTTFGSVEHRCSTNDKTVVEHVKADNTIMHMISEFDAKEWQFLSNTV
jgi:DNA-directed RNA polymerase subunit RPC12/RpoP